MDKKNSGMYRKQNKDSKFFLIIALLLTLGLVVIVGYFILNRSNDQSQLLAENNTPVLEDIEEEEIYDSNEEVTDEIDDTEEEVIDGDPAVYEDSIENQEEEQDDLTGYKTYIVKKGDTLWKISANSSIYNNPWRWKKILGANANKIKDVYKDRRGKWFAIIKPGQEINIPVADREEDSGTLSSLLKDTKVSSSSTATITGSDSQEYLKGLWTVQVKSMEDLSSAEELNRELREKGYDAYLSRGSVRGKDWNRVRVGFYRTKHEAEKAAKSIIEDVQKLNEYFLTIASKDDIIDNQ